MSAPAWADALGAHAAAERTTRGLVVALSELETAALGFCRLLERWARGEADPPTVPERTAALREAAARVTAALGSLERPLGRFLVELQPDRAEGRSWFGQPGVAELVDWEPVLERAGVRVPAHCVAAAYLELAVLIRALEGLAAAVSYGASPERGALWAGLFDLRDNLLGSARTELRLIAA